MENKTATPFIMRGTKVKCKYASDGTGRIMRKQGANGYMVEYVTTAPFQDFTTLKVTSERVERKVYIKTNEIEIIKE